MSLKNKIISIENLEKKFSNGNKILKNINLDIYESEFLIIAGENGSGKTVLMKHLNGLFKPTSGRIFFKDLEITGNEKFFRQKIGLVFQYSDAQIVGQTVIDDIKFGPENLGLPDDEIEKRVKSALLHTGLKNLASNTALTLSGGEKKRLGIAGVLAMDPDVIIFDEPFAGLDLHGVKTVLSTIINLNKKGHTIILITHDLEKCMAHADRIVIMKKGEITKTGTPDSILDHLESNNIKKPFGTKRKAETMTWMK
ncbi:MAG: ABC transporter ATP-binding protein [Spirochaetes bacterium]|nr:ABC transporter ATP-binding protein [Spirochaetota bacterium]